tara:strand:- start:46 stop:342 length:297 start_codon:yes stop_codon:yes gene_type:complete
MSEWLDSQQKPSGNFCKLLQERIEKTNPRRTLTAKESKRLSKLEGIIDKLRRGENVQNRQLQTWLSDDEYAHIERMNVTVTVTRKKKIAIRRLNLRYD